MTDGTEEITQNLDDVFNDDESEEQETEAEQAESEEEELKGETEETKESKEEPSGSEETKEESKAEPPSVEDEGKSVPITALQSERHKRQSIEEDLRKAKDELAKIRLKSDEVPDPDKDSEAYNKYIEVEENQSRVNARIEMSQEIMKESREDYDDVVKVFNQLATSDKNLHARMCSSKNPAAYAYKIAKNHMDTIEAEKVREKESIKAELRAEILAEMGKSEPKDTKKSALEVPDLTKATAKGSNSASIEKEYSKNKTDELFADSPF